MSFYLVDSFTDDHFKGNPAGVFIVDEFPDHYSMQRLANYYDWSEIAFVRHLAGDRYCIRWFSPLDEAPLCGHATLAAAHVISKRGTSHNDVMTFEYNTGTIQARLNQDSSITMSFVVKPIHKCSDVPFSVEEILGINQYTEILKDDLIYVIVMKSSDDVLNAVPNFELIKKIDARAIAITASQNGAFDFSSRYFAPKVGIYEDPVCGSMHCRLAYYWRTVLGKTRFKAYQPSSRTGVLGVEIVDNTVNLTGKAVIVCEFK
ncbi:MAG: PhzF family phenazine biosynthesis protein [Holosporales bacterium]|jgi:PhzF family phenazine biosynthesis protein|nr:PhzF family phenazine biosynthesis protein [Holosporales bacterium]